MKLSIFTPTFNRAYIIEKLYRSLQLQSQFEFEWIVIDDGSTDNTEELFKRWIKDENSFPITYLKQQNGGKHRAINRAVNLSKGELFFIVDSDDYLMPSAVERLIHWESTIAQKQGFCGISGLRGKTQFSMIGGTFSGDYCDAYYHERQRFNLVGDKAEAFYTSILKQFPFKEFDNETFLTEATVWLPMGSKYKIRYFNEIIYIGDYLSDGLSENNNKFILDNPKGYAYYIQQQIIYLKYGLKSRLASYYYYSETFKSRLSRTEILRNINIKNGTLLVAEIIFKTVNKVKKIIQ